MTISLLIRNRFQKTTEGWNLQRVEQSPEAELDLPL